MIDTFTRFLKPIYFTGEYMQSNVLLFHKMLIFSGLLTVFAEIIDCYLLPDQQYRWITISLVVVILNTIILCMNKAKRLKLASWLFISYIMSLIYFMAWFSGGVDAPIVQTIPIVLIAIGMLIGWKECVIMAIVSVVFCFGFVVSDWYRVLPQSNLQQSSMSLWVNYTIQVGFIVFLQYMIVVSLRKALNESQIELDLRIKTEELLKDNKALQKRVFETSCMPMVIMRASDYKYVDCNQAAIDAYQFENKENTLGKTPLDVSAPVQYDQISSEEKALHYINKALTDGFVVFEWLHCRPSGELWDAEVHLMSFELKGETYLQFSLIDITERKLAEKRLLEQTAVLEAQINASSDAIFVVDPQQKRLLCNKNVQAFFNVSSEILHNSDDTALLHHIMGQTSDNNRFIEKVQYLYRNPEAIGFDEIEFTSGKVLQRYSAPVKSQTGMYYGRVWTYRDITLQKLAEKEVLHSEAQFRSVLENISLIGIMLDTNGNIILCNEYFLRLTGWKREDALFINWFSNFLPQEIRKNIEYDVFTKALKTGVVDTYIENEILTKGFERRLIGWNNTVLKNNQGDVIGIALIGEDITIRRQTEAQILSLLNIIKQSINEIYVFDTETLRFIFINNGAIKNIGYSFDEMMLLTPLDIQPLLTDESFRKNIEPLINQQTALINFQTQYRRKDGTFYWGDISIQTIDFEGKKAFSAIVLDITERKNAEDALRESQERYQLVFENSGTANAIFDTNYRLIMQNQMSARSLGSDAKQALGKSALEIFGDERGNTIIERMQRVMNTRNPEIHETQFKLPIGTKWFRSSYNVLLSIEEEVIGIQVISQDITEQKQSALALQSSEERLREAQRIAMLGNWELDLITNKLYWSDEVYRIFELSSFEFEASYDAFLQTIHPDDRELVNQAYINSIESKTRYEIMHRLLMKDGRVKFVYERGETNYDDTGKAFRSIGTVQDITDQHLIELSIKENDELFKTLIIHAPYPISLTEWNGKIILCNQAFCQLLNLTENEIIGNTSHELGFEINQEYSHVIFKSLQETGKLDFIELPICHKGDLKVFLYACQNIQWKTKPVQLHTSIDISDKKKNEQELEQYRNHLEKLIRMRTDELSGANEELKSANDELYRQKERLQATLDALSTAQTQLLQAEKMASLGVLSAGIAHEINNPLNFIHGGSIGVENYCKSHLPEHSEKLKPLLDAINVGVKRASDIVSSLSRYSRRDDCLSEICNIHTIIDSCLIMLHTRFKGKVLVEKHYTEQNIKLLGKEGKLHQAILNILSNAEQAIDKQGIIRITTGVNGNHIVISITDSGQGIDSQYLSKIFDPFFTTKSPGKGTGLGLSITYNIINEHRGVLRYESEINKGTTAIIELPIEKQGEDGKYNTLH